MHVFPGLNYYHGKTQEFWRADFTKSFERILGEHAHRIQLIAGAHIHRFELRAVASKAYPATAQVPFLVTPSFSPVYNNNPGYAMLRIDDVTHKITDLTVRSLQLQYYLLLGKVVWSKQSPLEDYKLDANSPASLSNYTSIIKTPQEFG